MAAYCKPVPKIPKEPISLEDAMIAFTWLLQLKDLSLNGIRPLSSLNQNTTDPKKQMSKTEKLNCLDKEVVYDDQNLIPGKQNFFYPIILNIRNNKSEKIEAEDYWDARTVMNAEIGVALDADENPYIQVRFPGNHQKIVIVEGQMYLSSI